MTTQQDELSQQVKLPTFSYDEATIKDIICSGTIDINGRMNVSKIHIKGRETAPSQRFWDSLLSKFGIGASIFTYFTHAEVFERISEKSDKDEVRITVQDTPGGQPQQNWIPRVLSVSKVNSPILTAGEAYATLLRLDATNIDYRDGIFISCHNLRHPFEFTIGDDKFTTQLTLETPIDGYGKPNVYLAVKNDVTGANLTAYAKVFQTGIILGGKDSAAFTLQRAIHSFNNEDGFIALKQRLEASKNSWASVLEVVKLSRLIWKTDNAMFKPEWVATQTVTDPGAFRNATLAQLHAITGDLRAIWSIAQLDSLSEKRQRTLPAKCKVFDLIKFATDICSTRLQPESAKKIQMWIGETISSEYDLEESATKYGTFEDFVNTRPNTRFQEPSLD